MCACVSIWGGLGVAVTPPYVEGFAINQDEAPWYFNPRVPQREMGINWGNIELFGINQSIKDKKKTKYRWCCLFSFLESRKQEIWPLPIIITTTTIIITIIVIILFILYWNWCLVLNKTTSFASLIIRTKYLFFKIHKIGSIVCQDKIFLQTLIRSLFPFLTEKKCVQANLYI